MYDENMNNIYYSCYTFCKHQTKFVIDLVKIIVLELLFQKPLI